MDEPRFGEQMFVGIYTVDVRGGEDRSETGKRYCLSTENSGDSIVLADADDIASEIVQSISSQDGAEYLAEYLLLESNNSLETLGAALGELSVEYDIEQAVNEEIVPFDDFYRTPTNEAPERHSRWEEGQYRELEMTEKMTLLQHIRDRLESEYGDLLEEPATEE